MSSKKIQSIILNLIKVTQLVYYTFRNYIEKFRLLKEQMKKSLLKVLGIMLIQDSLERIGKFFYQVIEIRSFDNLASYKMGMNSMLKWSTARLSTQSKIMK